MLGLPKTATAPFCPSEVQGSVVMPQGLSTLASFLKYAGAGLLISVGYMDPGNWATDIEAGSRYGYGLLYAVALASLAGILLQALSARLGIVTGRDLAQLCRDRYRPSVARALWVFAEISIVACDVAEVLGGALALQLLFHLPLWIGVLLTCFDTVLVLGLKGRGFRSLEAIVAGLVATIAAAFAIELFFVPPNVAEVARGLFPSARLLTDPHAVYLAIGILGATVMPHNLYLHSSVVQTRQFEGDGGKRRGVAFATMDIALSLVFALLINGAILVVAGAAFHGRANDTADIGQAYKLLQPIAGSAAALIFGVALLASGQSSTFTGTIAGQVILEGFLNLKIPCWQQRLLTRALAIVPALIGVLWLGEDSVGKLLVLSQVVLSLQLPFALYPLIRFTNSRAVMGEFASGWALKAGGWFLFVAITAANLWLLYKLF